MEWDDSVEQLMQKKLYKTTLKGLDAYFAEYTGYFYEDDRIFSKYMRDKFREKGISRKDVFKRANLSEGYGYKLISEEKKTNQRDVILRLCISLHLSVDETQRALILSGFSTLCVNIRRDVILLVAIINREYDIDVINDYLTKHNEVMLYETTNMLGD